MANMDKSKFLYPVVEVRDNKELDYLDTALQSMQLSTATTFRIRQPFVFRPDLISEKFTGSYNYGWLIARHNNFLEPIFDFTEGTLINIPDFDEYFRFYSDHRIRRAT